MKSASVPADPARAHRTLEQDPKDVWTATSETRQKAVSPPANIQQGGLIAIFAITHMNTMPPRIQYNAWL